MSDNKEEIKRDSENKEDDDEEDEDDDDDDDVAGECGRDGRVQ